MSCGAGKLPFEFSSEPAELSKARDQVKELSSVRPATIVGSANGRSIRELTSDLPRKLSRTSTHAITVPITAFTNATTSAAATVSFSDATACGLVIADQNPWPPLSVERQMTAERTRDKMRAARRRGRWTGGMPPLGYDVIPEGGRIVVNEDEAATVVSIFELYLEKGSLLAVAQELRIRGRTRKTWTTREGNVRVGREFNNVDVHRLLTDVIYIGRQKLGDETFDGEHDAIVTKRLFDQVQRMLDANRRNSGASHRNRHGALLRGILRCAACDSAMTHTFNRNRHGRDYRYYRCVNGVKNGAAACTTGSVPAAKIEAFVVEQIQRIGSDPALCDETFRQVQTQVASERRGLKAEAKRIDRELAAGRGELDRVTATATRATGVAADALMAKLAETQERVMTLEHRHREATDRLATLAAQDVDPAEVGRALAQFTDIWDVLLTPERERVLRLLIERVDYHGANRELKITFSATGAKLLAGEIAS